MPLDENDATRFENSLKKCSADKVYNLFEKKYNGIFDDVREKIVASWERIFDITDKSEFVVQANLWQIKEEWIKHIVYPGDDFFEVVRDMEETWIE